MAEPVALPDDARQEDRSATRAWAIALLAVFGAGIAIRALVLPARGLVGDIDQFVLWVHGIAVGGWQNAYDQNLSFPPVMAWIWGILAAIEPAFRTVVDSSDPQIRSLMKVPATLADLGLAATVAWWFRDRLAVAIAAAAAILLWPATWYVSAWWGQYESIYVLPAAVAVVAARANRPLVAAALVAVSLMTKPQALPFLVPFAAWFLATQRPRDIAKAIAVGLGVVVLLWAPFLAAAGPTNYLANLGTYQDDIFSVLSLRAWNPWWVVQQLGANGEFVSDTTAVLGPLTFRSIGYIVTGLLSLAVFVGVYRRPSAQQLALGLATITLVAFVSLTTMHERYAYPAFVFLLLAATNRWTVGLWALFSVTFVANLVSAGPPPELVLPDLTGISVVGSGVITLTAALLVLWTGRSSRVTDA